MSGLPVVNAVLGRLGLAGLVARFLPHPDPARSRELAGIIGVLVRALTLGRQPLYGLGAWAERFDPALLGIAPQDSPALNDDRLGRALDWLYLADRASLTTAVGLATVASFAVSLNELHNDSTSICLYGAYQRSVQDDNRYRPPRPARGHSKDHRPDLKQLVWILTTSADGVVPVTYRMADGNIQDATTHIDTWDACRELAGRAGFLYVADCKLATKASMAHIAGQGGRFLTVLPRNRKEDAAGRAWLSTQAPAWVEIARQPGRRKHEPPDTWWALPAPGPSEEGFRMVWIRSSSKAAHDEAARTERIARATAALGEMAATLGKRWSRLRSADTLRAAADAAIAKAGAGRWVRAVVSESAVTERRQEGRGRPGPDTRYKEVTHSLLTLSVELDSERVGVDAASDGCFPFITNDMDMTPAQLLAAYKAQPHLERRHALLKGVLQAAPIELKSETRIDALGFCLYAALLVHALIERALRRNMAAAGVRDLPLYPEHRSCQAPTAARVLEVLEPLSRTLVKHRGHVLTTVPPALSPLQAKLLSLLEVPAEAYGYLKPDTP